jgi:hypothetical protein
MSLSPRGSPVIAAGWPDLVDELDRWQEAGRVATLWWRDDDAVAPSRSLERMASIAGRVPIALAAIPAMVQLELAAWLSHRARSVPGTRTAVLQHGWRHSNHSTDSKKNEFPRERSSDDVAFELAAGHIRLTELFGVSALPVLVPPWNRFDDRFLPLLARSGLRAISRAKPRITSQPAPGIVQANIHVDVVAWAGGRDFVGEKTALGDLITHLRARRLGLACADEPTGILTHHLVADEPTDTFLYRLLDLTGAHAAALWLDAVEIFVPMSLLSA